jgi:hypothetical protein
MNSLRQLHAKLLKTVTVTSAEQDKDGKWIWRDETGDPWFWSPHPYRYEFHYVETLAEADSISFLCPKCFQANGGPTGTHGVHVTFAGRNVPDEAGSRDHTGKPSRWNASGTNIDDLVLTPSISLDASQPPNVGCHWHGFVGSNVIPPGRAG